MISLMMMNLNYLVSFEIYGTFEIQVVRDCCETFLPSDKFHFLVVAQLMTITNVDFFSHLGLLLMGYLVRLHH